MHPYIDKFKGFFLKTRPAKATGQRLYAACVAQARLPRFYLDYGLEDVIGTRFELLTLHVGTIVYALKSETGARREEAMEIAQALFDAFLLALDSTLREQGVGDLSVPKKMKRLGTVVYTRMKHWDDLWTAEAGTAPQADYVMRTLYAGAAYDNESDNADTADLPALPKILSAAEALVTYIDSLRRQLDLADLLQGRVTWPELPAYTDAADETTAAITIEA